MSSYGRNPRRKKTEEAEDETMLLAIGNSLTYIVASLRRVRLATCGWTLDPQQRCVFAYYPSGTMVLLNQDALQAA